MSFSQPLVSLVTLALFVTIGPDRDRGYLLAGLTAGPPPKISGDSPFAPSASLDRCCSHFALLGNLVLSLLHISLSAFRCGRRILLFLRALTLTFSELQGCPRVLRGN